MTDNCYCGTYTGQHIRTACGTPPEQLTPDEVSDIRAFQSICGGWFDADLRTLEDYHLRSYMIDLIDRRAYVQRGYTDHTSIELEAAGLVKWWDAVTRNDGVHIRAHWHALGPITHVEHLIDKQTGRPPREFSLCPICSDLPAEVPA